MPMYHVLWGIDLPGETPQDAARAALAIQRDPRSLSTVFEVFDMDEPGEGIGVDVTELEGGKA